MGPRWHQPISARVGFSKGTPSSRRGFRSLLFRHQTQRTKEARKPAVRQKKLYINGASIELLAKITKTPNSTKKTRIGAIHHFLRSRRNSKNSLMIATLFMEFFLKFDGTDLK